MLQDLLPQAERIAAKLKARGETISIAESSTAGMISAALLAIAGASAYFIGGAVVYTRQSRTALLEVTEQELIGITPSTEAYALLFARKIRGKLATDWSVGETGTAGPTGSRYGHAAGHSCIAVMVPMANARSPSKPARATGSTTCAPFRSPRWISWRRGSPDRSDLPDGGCGV